MSNAAIPAATVLILRDAPRFEVLMIERHQDMDFAAGALVFPGGCIGESDRDPAWGEHCDEWNSADVGQNAARIAAIREAFEEAGILLARRAGGDALVDDGLAQALDAWRPAVEEDGGEFLTLMKREKLTLACGALRLFAHWRPRQREKFRRYDTHFFAVRAPMDQKAREDGNEATEVLWISPKDALRARIEGRRKMIFPTARNVELLGVSENVDAVFDFAARRKIVRVEPRLTEREDGWHLTIPDDLGYPVTEELIERLARS